MPVRRWGIGRPDQRPFARFDHAFVITPIAANADRDAIASFVALLERERAELVTELGCALKFTTPPSDLPKAAQCLIGPASSNPVLRKVRSDLDIPAPGVAHVWIDREFGIVVIDGPDIEAIGDAFQFLRTAIHSGARLTTRVLPHDAAEIVSTVSREVQVTYPAFALRSVDWFAATARHRDPIVTSGASLSSLQHLFVELEDAHSWARDRNINGRWPYRVWADRLSAMLITVPPWSAGWDAGARPGDVLLDVDTPDWWSRTSATPRTRPVVTGYRIMSGKTGTERTFRVRRASDDVVCWTEACPTLPWLEPVSWTILPSGTGYLEIRGWLSTPEWGAAVEAALRDLARCLRLIVDLRGNAGGNLVAAQAFRDRFLTGRTVLGSIRFSRGDGTLGDHSPIIGEPASSGPRWTRPVRFLTDRESYSATEDAILGLQGLPHVEVVGEPTGGGSGRPRTIPLTSRISATISRALTYDRHGRCIEGAGVPVDRALAVRASLRRPDLVPASTILSTADTGW